MGDRTYNSCVGTLRSTWGVAIEGEWVFYVRGLKENVCLGCERSL